MATIDPTVKGLKPSTEQYNGAGERFLIVHARSVASSSSSRSSSSPCGSGWVLQVVTDADSSPRARSWNDQVITPLVQGAVDTMVKMGVSRDNIVIETVPGSYELPMACSRCVPDPFRVPGARWERAGRGASPPRE